MKQKQLDTLGMPEDLVAKKRLFSRRQAKAGDGHTWFFSWKIAVLIFIVVILAALAWYLSFTLDKKQAKPSASHSGRSSTPVAQLPSGFPPDLPFIDAKTVLHNFTTDVKDTPSQGVRKWKITMPTADVYAAFEAYFKANGWEITTTLKADSRMLLAATRSGKLISVSIQDGPEAGTSFVEVGVRAEADNNSTN